jgi:hypothetical protein
LAAPHKTTPRRATPPFISTRERFSDLECGVNVCGLGAKGNGRAVMKINELKGRGVKKSEWKRECQDRVGEA